MKIREDSVNYTATVIKLPVKQEIPGLDNLVQVEVFGNACLIGKDSPEDIMYLYFPTGCALSQKFLKANNLYRDIILNNNPNIKGFFEPSGRVRGLKLKGVISTGFVIPATSLEIMLPYSEGGDISELNIGDEFNEWMEIEVCRKYIPKGQHVPGAKGDKSARINDKLSHLLIPTQFRFHPTTEHLSKHLERIHPDDSIVISNKLHGSSCILGYVYVKQPLNRLQRLLNGLKWLPKYPVTKLAYIYSSGKPRSNLPKGIIFNDKNKGWLNDGPNFYTSDIWKDTFEKYKHCIEEGISLYGEIVGFTKNGAMIQGGYDYGCEPGTSRFVIYKITYTKPNGEFIMFSWQQIKDYCAKYELEHIKEFYFGKAKDAIYCDDGNIDEWREWFFNMLQTQYNMEIMCCECKNKVPAEGIVVRKDGHLTSYEAYKLKSKLFLLKESNDEEPNIEDSQ